MFNQVLGMGAAAIPMLRSVVDQNGKPGSDSNGGGTTTKGRAAAKQE